jgi:hypothetical protein
MVRLFSGLLMTGLLSLGSTPGSAQSPAACGDRGHIAEKLDNGYSEKPVAMGLSTDGAVVEVFASNDGSFTIIVTRPNGLSCILVTGESWEDLMALKAGLKI